MSTTETPPSPLHPTANREPSGVAHKYRGQRPTATRGHIEGLQIDDGHFVGRRQRDVGLASVGRNGHAARLETQVHPASRPQRRIGDRESK